MGGSTAELQYFNDNNHILIRPKTITPVRLEKFCTRKILIIRLSLLMNFYYWS